MTSFFQLYSAATPNGIKVAACLEEIIDLRSTKELVEYEPHTVNIRAGESRHPDFPSPTGKIPCIIDPHAEGGRPITVFESGAILLYLAEKYKELLPHDSLAQRTEAIKWMMWGSTSISSQCKTLGFYYKYCAHKLPYCVHRYGNECKRLLGVLEGQLAKHGGHWVIGDAYTIADLAIWPWIHALHSTYDDVVTTIFDNMRDYPRVQAWYQRVRDRPAIQRALQVTPFLE